LESLFVRAAVRGVIGETLAAMSGGAMKTERSPPGVWSRRVPGAAAAHEAPTNPIQAYDDLEA